MPGCRQEARADLDAETNEEQPPRADPDLGEVAQLAAAEKADDHRDGKHERDPRHILTIAQDSGAQSPLLSIP